MNVNPYGVVGKNWNESRLGQAVNQIDMGESQLHRGLNPQPISYDIQAPLNPNESYVLAQPQHLSSMPFIDSVMNLEQPVSQTTQTRQPASDSVSTKSSSTRRGSGMQFKGEHKPKSYGQQRNDYLMQRISNIQNGSGSNPAIDALGKRLETLRNVNALRSEFDRQDLKPIANMVDILTGSNMANTYQAPETAMDDFRKEAGIEQQIAQYKQGDQNRMDKLAMALRDQKQSGLAEFFAKKNYVSPMDKHRTKMDLRKDETFKSFEVTRRLDGKLRAYQSLLEKHGYELPVGEDYAELENAYKELALEFKELAKLGALTGPDMDLVDGVVGKPTLLGQWQSGGSEGIIKRLDNVRKSYIDNYNKNQKSLRASFPEYVHDMLDKEQELFGYQTTPKKAATPQQVNSDFESVYASRKL